MYSKRTYRVRHAEADSQRVCASFVGEAPARRSRPARAALVCLLIALASMLAACSSGSGGDNGAPNPRDEVSPAGLTFSYPFNGQQDVVLDSQIVADFAADVPGDVGGALALQVDGEIAAPAISVEKDDNQPNILRLVAETELRPSTTYEVVATRAFAGSSTGDTLFQFTTRPLQGRPADGDFEVVSVAPGETNPVTHKQTPFTQFNAIRVILSEPVDPATVNADSFSVTGPDNDAVTNAKLTALGRYIVFDPVEDLAPGDYTIAWTSDIVSRFGKPLEAGSRNREVLSVGDPIAQTLHIDATGTDPANLPDNRLNGLATNNINIQSQLIGSNDQPVISPDDVDNGAALIRQGVETTLAQPGQPGFGDVIPAVIRGGQRFQLSGLTLRLGKQGSDENSGIATPIAPSGPLDINFINDVDVYLMANDYRNIETPTAVRLRFDLGIGALINATPADQSRFLIQQLANGVFNQSVLNIQAAGVAIPRDNGDLEISALGSFPLNVSRTDDATVDFELTLILAADSDDQPDVAPDTAPPIMTAQYPSACLYAFGSPLYDPFYSGASPTAFPDVLCTAPATGQPPPNGGLGVAVNSFPIEASPAVTFSSPIDPATVNQASVRLLSSDSQVDSTYRVEGSTIVIDPVDVLEAGTVYQIALDDGSIRDLDGNALQLANPLGPDAGTLTFTTEPQSGAMPAAPLLGSLSPGIACALEGGDFTSAGGSSAGNCVGDMDNGTTTPFGIFQHPANVTVDAFFSKFVDTSTITLANGCLAGGGSAASSGTVAIQRMSDDGTTCIGTVPGALAFGGTRPATDRETAAAAAPPDITRSFSFRPAADLEVGTRYWIVICGDAGGGSCSSSIADSEGRTLNTDPLNGTGSTPASGDAAGGPPIVMPFDATEPTEDYYANQFTLPESDTNGNGRFDDDENAQPGNRSVITILGNDYNAYLSLARPIVIGTTTTECGGLDTVTFDTAGDDAADTSAVGDTASENCIPVSLLPGGISGLTSINIGADALAGALQGALAEASAQSPAGDDTPIGAVPELGPALGPRVPPDSTIGTVFANAGAIVQGILNGAGLNGLAEPIQTGRVLLRFPHNADPSAAFGPMQTGYIVEQCKGSFADGTSYDFEPCFAASLTLVANAPDAQGLAFEQQPLRANVIGPVTFEQSGRLVISLRNANTLTLQAAAVGILPVAATIDPGALNFQLVGSPAHGGREFPNR